MHVVVTCRPCHSDLSAERKSDGPPTAILAVWTAINGRGARLAVYVLVLNRDMGDHVVQRLLSASVT